MEFARNKKFLNHIPKAIIYSICAIIFVCNIEKLIKQYLDYKTNVIIQYKTPRTMQFPSFTICGCCIKRVIQNDTANNIISQEMHFFNRFTAKQIIENVSFTSDELITSCTVMMDSKQNLENHCTNHGPMLQSIYNGRKCFTFLNELNLNKPILSGHIDNNNRYTAFVYVEIKYPINIENHCKFIRGDNALQNADIIVAIHPQNMLPTMLDIEFYRIDPNNMYEIQFTKEVTFLKMKPFKTACKNYNQFKSEYILGLCLILLKF